MLKVRALAIFNLLSLILQIIVAYGIQTHVFTGPDVSEISARNETLFTPTGFTFLIWGIIYTAMGVLTLYHFFLSLSKPPDHPANIDMLRMGPWLLIVNLASACWLFAWTREQLEISVGLIFLQLIGLAIINVRLKIFDRSRLFISKTFTQFPLSIYFGWITVASIANTASWLVSSRWDRFSLTDPQWAVVMIATAALLALLMVFIKRNFFFALVVAWGLFGIVMKLNEKKSNSLDLVINTAWLGIGLILIASAYTAFSSNRFRQQRRQGFPEASASLK